ncbi:LamG domain-containing protein [Alteromonadaceae bacterium BrNp21-10]|nr:LamG domain-containing protein [Alteromonadaceae bacterium BrNp21-10]
MKKVAVAAWVLLFTSHFLHADECKNVYPTVVQSYASTGVLTMHSGSVIVDSPTIDFPFDSATITALPDTTCASTGSAQTKTCTVSGSEAGTLNLPAFPVNASNSYQQFDNSNTTLGEGSTNTDTFGQVVINGGTMEFSDNYSEYFIKSLTLNNGAIVSLKPGTYWIDNLYLNAGSAGLLEVIGNGTVTVMVKNSVQVNNPIKGLLNDALLNMNVYQNLTLNSGGAASGVFYVAGDFTNNAALTGMISSANLTMNSGSAIYFDNDKFDLLDFGSLCESEPVELELLANYQFEESTWPANDTVLDSSANNAHGSSQGQASPLFPSEQKSCQVLDVPFNNDANIQSAVDTQVDVNEIGNKGTVSFWYRSNEAWNSGSPRQLLDASTDNNGNANDKYFFLAINSSGRLRFGLEDTDDRDIDVTSGIYNFAADQWVHIAVSWDMASSELDIFVNGVAATLSTNGGGLNGQIADLYTLYIGDNRSSYIVSNLSSTANSANGQFDDVRIYSGVQTGAEIAVDMAELSPCAMEAMAFYEFEQLQWSGNGAVIDSSANSLNGTAKGSVSPLFPTEQKSCKVLDVPFNNSEGQNSAVDTRINVNDIGNKGSISFWYRSNQAWNSGGDRQLFDATNASTGDLVQDQVFFLTLTSSGTLHFSLEDSDDLNLWVVTNSQFTFAANEWVHVAVTWDMSNNNMGILVNGNPQFTSGISQSGVGPNIGNYASLYFGDSRSNYVIANQPHTHNSANGQFDDIRIYQSVQSAASVAIDMADVRPCDRSLFAFYKFEESEWSNAGDVLDSSGNTRHGSGKSDTSPAFPSEQKSCKVLDVPANSTETPRAAVDTEIDINDLGNQGSISFWYRSNLDWSSGGKRQLLDASNTGTSPAKFFYLAITDSGALQFAVEDNDDLDLWVTTAGYNFAADQWVHLAITWDMELGTLRILINGNEVPSIKTTQAGFGPNIGNLDTLYIGDSRSSYLLADQASSHQSANGQFDDVRIYSFVQSALEVTADMQSLSPCVFIDHYRLEFPAQGYTCAAVTVSAKACQNETCSSTYDSSTTLDLVTSVGAFSPASLEFTGTGDTLLSVSTADTASFSVTSSTPDAPVRCFADGVEGVCQISFVAGGLSVSWMAADPLLAIPDQLSQQTLNEDIVITNDAGAACAADLAGSKLMLAMDCVSPASCNSDMLVLGGDTINQPDAYSDSGYVFDANGQVVIPAGTIRYDDAGQIRLLVKDEGDLVAGASNDFVALPELRLSHSALPVHTAGIDFDLGIAAVGQLSIVTPNYQPGNLQLQVSRTAPLVGGSEGDLVVSNKSVAGLVEFNTGSAGFGELSHSVANFNQGQSVDLQSYYSEVGEIALQARDSDYFGNVLNSNSVAISRFIPAYFEVTDNDPLLQNSCNNFTYVGEPMHFLVDPLFSYHPKNAKGEAIANYIGDYMKLAAPVPPVPSSTLEFEVVSASIEGTLSLPDVNVAEIELTDSEVKYVLDANPQIPFESAAQVSLLLSDSDGVCYNSDYVNNPASCETYTISDIGGANMRYGRLVMENAYGPETEAVYLSMTTEYYNASENWVINRDDNCTVVSAANIKLDELNDDYSGLTPADIPVITGSSTFSSGKSISLPDSIKVEAAGQGNQIEFPVITEQPDYLFFDWNEDGSIQPPSAIITFGQFRGNDRIINWREVFN